MFSLTSWSLLCCWPEHFFFCEWVWSCFWVLNISFYWLIIYNRLIIWKYWWVWICCLQFKRIISNWWTNIWLQKEEFRDFHLFLQLSSLLLFPVPLRPPLLLNWAGRLVESACHWFLAEWRVPAFSVFSLTGPQCPRRRRLWVFENPVSRIASWGPRCWHHSGHARCETLLRPPR